MINENRSYFLGLLYSKGNIIELEGNKIFFRLNIKYRRPNDESIRRDNKYTTIERHEGGKEKLASRFIDDINDIKQMLSSEFNLNFDVLMSRNNSNWDKKVITIESSPINSDDSRFLKLLNVSKLTADTLKTFPFNLKIEEDKVLSLAFIQGVCDGCSLIPNEASSQNGGEGNPRVQIEPDQDRWELCIGLCKAFQIGLGIRVNNINWGHPEIRTIWRGQNHQFRVSLKDIPPEIELYRLNYKREEYHNLYNRSCRGYEPTKELCPLKKKNIREGQTVIVKKCVSKDLMSPLLDKRLKGLSINQKGIKSLIICHLLGCDRCRDYFNIKIED